LILHAFLLHQPVISSTVLTMHLAMISPNASVQLHFRDNYKQTFIAYTSKGTAVVRQGFPLPVRTSRYNPVLCPH
jgi:hypothetical protein